MCVSHVRGHVDVVPVTRSQSDRRCSSKKTSAPKQVNCQLEHNLRGPAQEAPHEEEKQEEKSP